MGRHKSRSSLVTKAGCLQMVTAGVYSVEHVVFVEVKLNLKLKNDRYTNYEVL